MAEPTQREIEAVRAGCRAVIANMKCSYPECTCLVVPAALEESISCTIYYRAALREK